MNRDSAKRNAELRIVETQRKVRSGLEGRATKGKTRAQVTAMPGKRKTEKPKKRQEKKKTKTTHKTNKKKKNKKKKQKKTNHNQNHNTQKKKQKRKKKKTKTTPTKKKKKKQKNQKIKKKKKNKQKGKKGQHDLEGKHPRGEEKESAKNSRKSLNLRKEDSETQKNYNQRQIRPN